MAISKAMRAALSALSYPEIDVKRTYPLERELKKLTSRRIRKPDLYRVWEHEVPSGDHTVPVRIFTPSEDTLRPVLLFFHGGGWVTGNIDSYDGVCADMAALTRRVVVSVDYQLAPEHPFPAGLEDCYAAARELFLRGSSLCPDPREIVLIGDSAGGNLAAALSLLARDRGEFLPTRQILIYPAVGNDYSESSPFPSVHDNGSGYLLTTRRIRDYMALYRSSEADLTNPYFAPLTASDLSRQPDTLIITAEYCPLRDEAEAYGERLRAAGSRVQTVRMPDALHGYFSLPAEFKPVRQTYDIINRYLEDGSL